MVRNLSVAGALTVAVTISVAAPASADELDFISALDKNGIYYANINDMIDVGKQACHGMRAHLSGPVVAARVSSAGGYTQQESAIILTAAANYMCPDVWPYINSGANPAPAPASPAPLPSCAPNCGED
jgi:hypothetical protein